VEKGNNQVMIFSKKAENAGLKVIAPNGTSQECSSCGHKVKKPLSQRMHNCPKCRVNLCRDLNASINTRTVGHTVLKLSQCPHRGVAQKPTLPCG
jgi:putative transposase